MSRHNLPFNEHTTIHSGSDHAIGRFIDIADSRYAGHISDVQGEGYVFEWSEMFGISTNLIGATEGDLKDRKKLIDKTAFIKSLK